MLKNFDVSFCQIFEWKFPRGVWRFWLHVSRTRFNIYYLKNLNVMKGKLNVQRATIEFYIITQVILAFWLVLSYDLLEDRRTIVVIITKVFFCVLNWRRDLRISIIFYETGRKKRSKKVLSMYWTGTRSRKKKTPFFFRRWLRKILEQSQSVVERD